MSKQDIKSWTIVGAFIGAISTAIALPSYAFLGLICGGVIGYLLGKSVK